MARKKVVFRYRYQEETQIFQTQPEEHQSSQKHQGGCNCSQRARQCSQGRRHCSVSGRCRPCVHLQKTPHSGGGSARPHAVKFSGPGDATNAHVDTDHGTILYQAGVRLIFWGREWVSAVPPVSVTQVVSDVQSILSGPYLDGLAQYGVSRPHLDSVLVLNTEDPTIPSTRTMPGTWSRT